MKDIKTTQIRRNPPEKRWLAEVNMNGRIVRGWGQTEQEALIDLDFELSPDA